MSFDSGYYQQNMRNNPFAYGTVGQRQPVAVGKLPQPTAFGNARIPDMENLLAGVNTSNFAANGAPSAVTNGWHAGQQTGGFSISA